MTQEEKAKAYDKAIERAEGLIDFCSDSELKTLEYVFPELAESEDERIRKEMITYLSTVEDKELIPYESWIAWLEKQGEQKPDEEYNITGISSNKSQGKLGEIIKNLKTTWSEEDERMCQETIDWFEKKCFPYALESENPAIESIKWLKSLKERYTWKPSDEQMKQLGWIVEQNKDNVLDKELMTLYNDLKRLLKI